MSIITSGIDLAKNNFNTLSLTEIGLLISVKHKVLHRDLLELDTTTLVDPHTGQAQQR